MEIRKTFTNLSPENFRDLAIGELLVEARERFDRGQAEKQDSLVERVKLKDIEEELIDALFTGLVWVQIPPPPTLF